MPGTPQFHLLFDPRQDSAARAEAPGGRASLRYLEISTGVWFLTPRADGTPALTEQPPAEAAWWCALEPVFGPPRPRLLLFSPAGHRTRVNGRPAPCVTLLDVKDEVLIEGVARLHVTVYYRPAVGPPPPDAIGRECTVCRVPFSAETTVYSCSCGTTLHCEGEGKLECALVGSECPACTNPVVLKPGYTYLPEGAVDG